MPALPHPLTLEDHMLAGHRWRARRTAWAQSLFVGAGYVLLGALLLWAWLRSDPQWLIATVAWIDRHAAALAVVALGASAWSMRRCMTADAQRHARSSHAALPIWRDVQRHRDTRLRWRFALQLTATMALVAALAAMHDVGVAGSALDALRWSWLAAVLALVFVPGPRTRPGDADARAPRLAQVPRWIARAGAGALPHLPQWWWQRAGTTWMRGRAAGTLAVSLLVAPSEAAALIVPVVLLLLMALANALDVAHRLAGDVSMLLSERPPCTRRLWRSLMPLHGVLALLFVALVLVPLHLLGFGATLLILVGATILLIVQIDFLLALLLRQQPARLSRVRLQGTIVAAALASALAPLLPIASLALWAWLLQRVRRECDDA